MFLHIENSWKEVLGSEFLKAYYINLEETLAYAYHTETVYPPQEYIYNALLHTPFDRVCVVIIGQDPYHGPNQAHGLAFSVLEGQKIPPSLRNIYKEILTDTGQPSSTHGNLAAWANQGVLLLNATLSVRAGEAGSHQKIGWGQFTDAVIQKISEQKTGVVFMLWGKFAEMKGARIDRTKHLVLTAAHPSPLSAYNGFFGCRHFSQCNDYLKVTERTEITW